MSEALITVKKLYTELASGNISKILTCLDLNVTVHNPDSLPYGGTYHGREGFIKMISGIYSTWATIEFNPDSFLVVDGLVIVRGEFQGRSSAADKMISMRFLHIWELPEGVIISIWYYFWDTSPLLNYLTKTDPDFSS